MATKTLTYARWVIKQKMSHKETNNFQDHMEYSDYTYIDMSQW